jgi:hypothetical protein
METLAQDGVLGKDGSRLWAVHMGTKGDLLALTKLGGFKRDYSRMPKAAQSGQACPGLCHLCLAGLEQPGEVPEYYPYEDFNTSALWKQTMHTEVPWSQTPEILRGALFVPHEEAAFFLLDVWHMWHYGAAKVFIANVVVILESKMLARGGNMVERLAWFSGEYNSYLRSHRLSSPKFDINKETMGYTAVHCFPSGHWNKGSISTNLMYWLEDFFRCNVDGATDDPLLLAMVTWLHV